MTHHTHHDSERGTDQHANSTGQPQSHRATPNPHQQGAVPPNQTDNRRGQGGSNQQSNRRPLQTYSGRPQQRTGGQQQSRGQQASQQRTPGQQPTQGQHRTQRAGQRSGAHQSQSQGGRQGETGQGLQYGGEARHGQSSAHSHVGTTQTFGQPNQQEGGGRLRQPQSTPQDRQYPQNAYPQVGGNRGQNRFLHQEYRQEGRERQGRRSETGRRQSARGTERPRRRDQRNLPRQQ